LMMVRMPASSVVDSLMAISYGRLLVNTTSGLVAKTLH
jgi:hypothetical protein